MTNKVIQFSIQASGIIGNFLDENLLWLRIVSFIISGLLLWGIIYCILGSSYLKTKTDQWMDFLGVGDVGRRRQLRGWRQIKKRLKTDEMTNWKLAIAEADKILDEIFKMSGLRGETTEDRFKQVAQTQLSNIEEIMQAHKLRDRVMREPDFVISQEEAGAAIAIYQKAFKKLGLLD